MGVGHFETKHHLGHLLTGEGLLDGQGHLLGKHLITGNLIIVHVEDIVYLSTGNDEGMTLHQRIDVEKCVELLVLCALVAGNLTSSNLTEYIHLVIYDLQIYDLRI